MKAYETWQLVVVKNDENYGDVTETTGLILHRPTGRLYCRDPHLLDQAQNLYNIKSVNIHKVMSTDHAAHIVFENRMERVPILLSLYDRVQRYGRTEEGEWYYHNQILKDTIKVWRTPFLASR